MSPEILQAIRNIPGSRLSKDGTQIIGPTWKPSLPVQVLQTIHSEYSVLFSDYTREIALLVMGVPYLLTEGIVATKDFRVLSIYDPPLTVEEFLKTML